MKLGNEKMEVFKDPSPIQSLRDVGSVLGAGVVGAVAGGIAGAFGGLGAAVIVNAPAGGRIMELIIGGITIGAVTGAAAGVALAINGCGFDKLIDESRKVAKAPGFDRNVLDTPVKGLMVGEQFIVHQKESTNYAGAFLGAGLVGVAAASMSASAKQERFDEYARNPNHRHGRHVGHWEGKESLMPDDYDNCRNTRQATLRDVIEFKDQVAGKEILREFIQTGRIDSFKKEPPKVELDSQEVERSSNRLAGFMKTALKTDVEPTLRNSPKPG